MRIFAITALDDPAAADGSYAGFADPDAGNGGDGPPHAINGPGSDWQTVDIPPYQTTAAALGQVTVSAFDPVGAGGWLTQTMQTPHSEIDGWLTQAMQESGAANQSPVAGLDVPSPGSIAATSLSASLPGFDADWPLITGLSGLVVPLVVTPNPSQTHTA